MLEQGLVCDRDDRLTAIIEIADEKPRLEQCLDQLPRRRTREGRKRRHAPQRRRIVFDAQAHQFPQDQRKRAARLRADRLEHFLRALRERAGDAAQLLIGAEGQHVVVAAALVQFLEQELQQGQGGGIARRGIANGVVEPLGGVRAQLEAKARRGSRQANDLADLAHGRRQQVELSVAFLERHEHREIRQSRIEIAAHRRHDPDAAGARKRIECRREALALPLIDPVVGKDLLQLVDDERKMSDRIRLAARTRRRRAAPLGAGRRPVPRMTAESGAATRGMPRTRRRWSRASPAAPTVASGQR